MSKFIEPTIIANGSVVTIGSQLAMESKYPKVKLVRQIGLDVNFIACGYAQSGNNDKVAEYYQEHGSDYIYIHGKEGTYDLKNRQITLILDKYLGARTKNIDPSTNKTKEYFYGSFFSVFQKSFQQK